MPQLFIIQLLVLLALPYSTQAIGCGGKADVVFLLDTSGSMGQSNFRIMLQFVKQVAASVTLGPNDVQIGLDTFSNIFRQEFLLSDFTTLTQMNTAIDKVYFQAGVSNLDLGIRSMTSRSFTAAAGHRAGVPKIAIIMTDGKGSNSSLTKVAAANAQQSGIRMFAIAIGNTINYSELNVIASDPDSQHVFTTTTFRAPQSLSIQTCHSTPSLGLATTPGPTGSCPGLANEGICYIYINEAKTWFEAQARCGNIQGQIEGHLIEITSFTENLIVSGLATDHGAKKVWLGLQDLMFEGNYVWASSLHTVTGYTHWNTLYGPGNNNPSDDCGAMLVDQGGSWTEVSCMEQLPFVCQTGKRVSLIG